MLDPDVVLRADGGTARGPARPGDPRRARRWPGRRSWSTRLAPFVRPALVNGAAGAVVVAGGRALSVMGFTVADGRIVAIDVLSDPDRLAELDLTVFDESP